MDSINIDPSKQGVSRLMNESQQGQGNTWHSRTTETVLSSMWVRMTQQYPTWETRYGEFVLENHEWRDALCKLSPEHIALGIELSRLSARDYPPSLPVFLDWCNTPPPSLEDATRQIERGTATHPCVKLAMRHESPKIAYQYLVGRWKRGEDLTRPIVFQLVEPDEPPATKEEARAALDELAKVLGLPRNRHEGVDDES